MADKAPDAGTLNQKVRVLACTPMDEEKTAWEWTEVRKAWAAAEPVEGTAVFANSGVGGRKVVFTLRRQRLDLSNAIRWRERFCLLTSVAPLGPGHLTVTAALVEPVECVSDGMRFPAVRTEKYVGHAQEWPMSVNELTLVLVTPKAITLKPGHLVYMEEQPWEILVPHELDPYKNEYEVGRRSEL